VGNADIQPQEQQYPQLGFESVFQSTSQFRYTQLTANLPAALGWRQDTLWHKLHNAFTDTNHLVLSDGMHLQSIN
jgi:hypothetical protein